MGIAPQTNRYLKIIKYLKGNLSEKCKNGIKISVDQAVFELLINNIMECVMISSADNPPRVQVWKCFLHVKV